MRVCFVFLLLLCSATVQAATAIPAPPQLSAKAYVLMDAKTGEVLVEHNADLPLPPASLTKMMTSYVLAGELAAGRVKPDDQVIVSENAWSQNPLFKGSSLMWIEPGKPVTLDELHRGIVIASGNDATVAVAEHIAGSESVFADMMNRQARELGMHDTWYVNSHGLPDPQHVTTARDLATLSRAIILDYPKDYALYKVRDFTYNGIRQYNRNSLLAQDGSVDGLKTGHTEEAGYCLVASAKRRDMRLISVVMGTDSKRARAAESRSLLNYGFRFYESVDVEEADKPLASVKVWKGAQDEVQVALAEPLQMVVPRGQKKKLKQESVLLADVQAPIRAGQELGTLKVMLNGKVMAEEPLVATQEVAEGGLFKRLWHSLWLLILSFFQSE
ncbi:MAG: serine-type D-Ala-D-Ala carboxypeptidase [Gammaproteobacteria bacterium]|nr:MAG: serine-type D-Ala-D-Ala carboxypeptidase [Gammaproteobacteria bacterium]PIE39565.1 MAG: serine-type D-Ala-D-Ala carboxypeptidase [Gammaproteobacteria bacterium]